MTVTQSELLDALAASVGGTGPEDARTTLEWAQFAGATPIQMKRALHELQAQGRLQSHRVRRPRLDGIMTVVSAYTILPTKKRK